MASQEDGTIRTNVHAETVVFVVPAERPAPKHTAGGVDFDHPILQGILSASGNDVAIARGLNSVGLGQVLVHTVAAEQ